MSGFLSIKQASTQILADQNQWQYISGIQLVVKRLGEASGVAYIRGSKASEKSYLEAPEGEGDVQCGVHILEAPVGARNGVVPVAPWRGGGARIGEV